LKIIPISDDQIDLILEIYQNCEDFLALGPVAKASKDMVLADMAHAREIGSIYCGLYTDQDRLIGIVEYLPMHHLNVPGAAFIELVMIAVNFRGQGFGSKTIQDLEALIWADPNVHSIDLAVQVNNPAARRFWERHGYLMISGPEYQPDGTTVFTMQKTRQ
jgi:ribosomal protein S18 acetylase RimI-like enzyme